MDNEKFDLEDCATPIATITIRNKESLFSINLTTNERCVMLTGLQKNHFDELCKLMKYKNGYYSVNRESEVERTLGKFTGTIPNTKVVTLNKKNQLTYEDLLLLLLTQLHGDYRYKELFEFLNIEIISPDNYENEVNEIKNKRRKESNISKWLDLALDLFSEAMKTIFIDSVLKCAECTRSFDIGRSAAFGKYIPELKQVFFCS
ncbi:hypothetical protein EIN_486660 [Entamoeba invadens IP1]|uniref:Uncharacterized protein n=1 Tax=Entamoeba invadens IP1 TaxID=370355 RepID=A0A0A1U4U7_ENTIV|nr:hypothetical protein EIN_486660 [Entamoeba invadens IP1]ELP89214.1 hypothetical protein EIN_486660 [Entamoeba invadens IP1]|eukprot:XP_004255985.1 hypothetical protein EIN_486660 [Entamoeba invadens IP1]